MLGISAIGGFFGRLFGTEKAAEKLVDSAVNALDKLVYTSEEKAEDNAKSVTEARQMVVNWLACTQGQNLARRLLALSLSTVWLSQKIICMALISIAPWCDGLVAQQVRNPVTQVLETITVTTGELMLVSANALGDFAQDMTGAMMLVLAFYFAAPHMDKIVVSAINKFGKGGK